MTTGNLGYSSPAIGLGKQVLDKLSLFVHRFGNKFDDEASDLVALGRKAISDLTTELLTKHSDLEAERAKTATLLRAQEIERERKS